MNRGGLRLDSEGTTKHLFKAKWNLGKTTAVRVPDILKSKLLELAKYLDSNQELNFEELDIKKLIEHKNYSDNQINLLNNKIKNLESKIKKLEQNNQLKLDSIKYNNISNNYKIALQFFDKYLVENQIKIPTDRKPRKGTILRQLFDFRAWLKTKIQSLND